MRAVWVMALAALAEPAIAADQFDLVCHGGKSDVRYRIDLANHVWCQGGCSVIKRLASVTDGDLVLVEHQPAFPGDEDAKTEVSRITGEWHEHDFIPKISLVFSRDGVCERATFSGFPTAKF